jgi:hypothetical protein
MMISAEGAYAMKFLFKIGCLAVFILQGAYALDIDDKLTSRILRVSSSQHTILLNRGLEDGLVLGDHAKFFLPEGVIARGVIVKASPTRSVWSLYRLINPDLIKTDTVVEIKIATPVQLTSDPSKAFERTQGPSDVLTQDPAAKTVTAIAGVPLGNAAPAAGENLSASDQEDLAQLGISTNQVNQLHKNEMPSATPLADRLWELWAGGHYATLTAQEDNSFEKFSYKTAPSVSLGAERYFAQGALRKWSFSLYGHLYNAQKEVSLQLNENNYENKISTYNTRLILGGVAGTYHFWHDPLATYQVIGFATASLGGGMAKDYIQYNNKEVAGEEDFANLYNGSSYFGTLGVGAKFYTDNGAGVRLTFDYYLGRQIYAFDGDFPDIVQTFSGIRWMIAGSYRF